MDKLWSPVLGERADTSNDNISKFLHFFHGGLKAGVAFDTSSWPHTQAEFQIVTLACVPQRVAQPEVSNCLEKSHSKGEVSPSLASMVNYPCWLIMLTNSLQ